MRDDVRWKPAQVMALIFMIGCFALLLIAIIGGFATKNDGKPDACGTGTALVTDFGHFLGTDDDKLICVPVK